MDYQTQSQPQDEDELAKRKILETKIVSGLSNAVLNTVYYHSLFGYPLTAKELVKWASAVKSPIYLKEPTICFRNGYFYPDYREEFIVRRKFFAKEATEKMRIAKKAAKILSLLPSIKMIATTGSLAMRNSKPDDDIDLLIVTRKGTLWTTRVLSYALLKITGIKIRKPEVKIQKDRLCLNMWLDENDLSWEKRNIYTAHELAQMKPLTNKDLAYERLLSQNKWILNWWPSAVTISEQDIGQKVSGENALHAFFERYLYLFQRWYMRKKVTLEKVSPTRAIFHPRDLSREFGRLLRAS